MKRMEAKSFRKMRRLFFFSSPSSPLRALVHSLTLYSPIHSFTQAQCGVHGATQHGHKSVNSIMLHSIQTGTCRHTCIDTNTYKYWINRIYVLPVHEPVHVLIGTPWGENLPATNGLHLHMDEHIPSSIHSSMVRSFVHYSATQ